jgi:hypothetical protein
MTIRLRTQNITNMYTPIELVSTNIGQVAYGGGGGGMTDHGYLHGLGDNDHPQYLLSSRSTQFMPIGNSASYQYLSNSSLSLGTAVLQSFLHTSLSSNLIAVSNSSIFAVSNHTHTGLGGAASDHSHGSVYTASTTGTDIKLTSNSTGLSIGVPKYITTAYGNALQGSGTYSQNTGTIQFSNSNGVTFGLNTNGVMTASIPAIGGAQTGISAIAGSAASSVTDGTIQFANANGISFGLNGNTMTASYVPKAATVFSNSNNVEFGLAGSTITALALFAQSTQTNNIINAIQISSEASLSGLLIGDSNPITSGTLTLIPGPGIVFIKAGNGLILADNAPILTLGGNTSGTMSSFEGGVLGSPLTIAGGNNITLSQSGNAFTISGANQGGVQTGISGIGASNTTYNSGTVIWSGQNNITIGSFVTSNSQYVRLSVGNYLTTAANSTHDHGVGLVQYSNMGSVSASSNSGGFSLGITGFPTSSFVNVSQTSTLAGQGFTSQSTTGTDIKATHNSLGLNLAVPKYITAPGAHTHGSLNLSLSNLSGGYSSASDGLSISITGYNSSNFANISDLGNIYFGGGSNITWSSSTSGNSTSIMATAGGGTGGGAGMALAFSGNTTGTTQTINSGTINFVGGNNITLSQAGSIVTIVGASANTVAQNWVTATKTGSDIQISTGSTNTLHYGRFITTYVAGTGVGTGLATTAADVTFNSNGLSFDGGRYARTGFSSATISGSNISGSLDTANGLRIWVPNYLTTQTMPSNTVSFVDGGGITWGTSVGSATNVTVVTATVQGGTGGAGTNYSFGNSNGISFGTTGSTVTASMAAHTQYAGILTTAITGASATINSSQIQLNIPVGSIYFRDSNGHSFSSSVSGASTTIYIVT